METDQMKKCPYCAEMIREEAIKCRYCGHMLMEEGDTTDGRGSETHWKRVNEDKRVAGVCTGIAQEFDAPRLILPLRLFFILSTIFYGFGLVFYIVLWILMPPPVDIYPTKASREAGKDEGLRRRRVGSLDIVLSLLLVGTGVLLMLVPLTRGHLMYLPLHGILALPRGIVDNIQWVPGLWILFIVLGLLLIFLGAFRVFRIVLGCGLVALGSMLLFLFVPFMPRLLFFPGFVVIGLILLILGGIKLALDSANR